MYLATKIVLPLAIIAGLAVSPFGTQFMHAGRGGLPDVPLPAPEAAPAAAEAAEEDPVIKEATKNIDAMLDAAIAGQPGLKVQPKTKDEQFLRRVYLDLAGRIPTFEEAGEFSASHKKDKRELLVKKLLASEAYVSNTFTWWADLLRAKTRLQDRYDGTPYIDWIKQSIRENKPYDKFVYELVSSQGPATSRGNGATGYYVADAGMPQDNMANTVRVFLGTRLSCAQCHDHPFDKWTRKNFFEMAAFTEGTDVKTNEGDISRAMKKVSANVPYAADQIARRVGETLGVQITNGTAGAINLPRDYQYKDARGGQRVTAITLFKDDILKDNKSSPREAYGKWMTSPENPRFTMVIANRLWKRLMRVGLVEPLDNFEDETKASNPELMELLVKLMKDVKYDMRKFQEAICNTNAYQRQTITTEANRFKFFHEGMPLRRLTAEQMWDSLMTLTIADVDAQKGRGANHLYKFYDANKDKSTEQIATMVVKAGEAADQIDEMEKEIRELRGKNEGKIKELQAKQNGLRPASDVFTPYYDASGKDSPHLRASELQSPMEPGHLLRVFGQSNRLVIDNSSSSLNLTQALELMNGMVESTVFGDEKSVLKQKLALVKSNDDKVRMLYVAILSRMPNSNELAYGFKVMSLAPNKRGIEYLGWALINSAEFAFNE